MGFAIDIGIFLVTLTAASAVAPAGTGASPAQPGADAKRSGSCHTCTGPIQPHDAALVIVTTLAAGGHVAVWQSTFDGGVYVQCYTRTGLSRGAQFRLNAEAGDGILPVLVPRENGGFEAWWQQDGQRFEQRFSDQCVPLGDATWRQ